jgi:DnaJ-class molecular chaperone
MKIKTCPDCNGDGVVDKDTDNERQCPTCGGLGFVPDDDDEEVIKTITNACKNPLRPCQGRATAPRFQY